MSGSKVRGPAVRRRLSRLERHGDAWIWQGAPPSAVRTIAVPPAAPGSLPAYQGARPSKAGPERAEPHQVPALDASHPDRLLEADRDRGGGGVAVPLDVVE